MGNLNLSELVSTTCERSCNRYNPDGLTGARRTVSRGNGHASFRIFSSWTFVAIVFVTNGSQRFACQQAVPSKMFCLGRQFQPAPAAQPIRLGSLPTLCLAVPAS